MKNGVDIALRNNGAHFMGLGQVSVNGVSLRSDERAMFVEILTPDGVTMRDFQLLDRQESEDGVLLDFAMQAQAGGIMEWMVHALRPRRNTANWDAQPEPARATQLRLEIKPVNRTIGGREYVGFSYQYHYRSEDFPIYKIVDRGTWEIDGQAVGNEFWMRNCFAPSIMRFDSPAQHYSSEWYLPNIFNPNIFQFLPLQTELQGFTFTTAASGTLLSWATTSAHVRSLFEKPYGDNVIAHWHEHCGDLAHDFSSTPVEVLWSPGELERVARINAYEAVRDFVFERLHEHAGLQREYVTTYGQIEEWGQADLPRYTALGVPKLLDAGCKTVYIANHLENNMNVYGVSNMCCTLNWKVAESVGEENLRALCQRVQAGGARVEMWANPVVSTLSLLLSNCDGNLAEDHHFLPREGSLLEMFATAKQPWLRMPSGAYDPDHYSPSFAMLNMRDPVVQAHWLATWKHLHDSVGLEGMFQDSSFNLSSDHFHYMPNATQGERHGATADQVELLGQCRPANEPPAAILSQYRAHLEVIAGLQQMGCHYCGEDIGVFGTHRHGPGVELRLDCLSIWQECIANFDKSVITKAGGDPDEVFFRGLAYRMMWSLCWDISGDQVTFRYDGSQSADDQPNVWHLSLLRAFNTLNDVMTGAREVLPGEAGVLYRKDGKTVLWAFTDVTLALPASTNVQEVLSGESMVQDTLSASRHHIYLVNGDVSLG